MKNAIKIQSEIMKRIKKYGEHKERRNAVYSVTEICGKEKILVTLDGFTAYCFNSNEFYLNASKMGEMNSLKTIFAENEITTQEPIEATGVIKKCKNVNAVEFENKNFKVYLDEKLIKNFGKIEDLIFAGKGAYKAVYVFEYGEIVGVIMPLNPRNIEKYNEGGE